MPFTVSAYAIAVGKYGYRLTSEDFVTNGLYNNSICRRQINIVTDGVHPQFCCGLARNVLRWFKNTTENCVLQ